MDASIKELNEQLMGLHLLRVEEGDEIDLVFGDYTEGRDGREIFRLQLAYGPGIVITKLINLNKSEAEDETV